jgi:hypothetical protein
MSRSFGTVPPNGGRANISPENQERYRRKLVPSPVAASDGPFSEEVWTQKAKRLAKRNRAKKERRRQWDDC